MSTLEIWCYNSLHLKKLKISKKKNRKIITCEILTIRIMPFMMKACQLVGAFSGGGSTFSQPSAYLMEAWLKIYPRCAEITK